MDIRPRCSETAKCGVKRQGQVAVSLPCQDPSVFQHIKGHRQIDSDAILSLFGATRPLVWAMLEAAMNSNHARHQATGRLEYDAMISKMRRDQYPMLDGITYLDHAGTALYSKSLIESFAADMMSNLVGNPHSANPSAMTAANRVENVRLEVLKFFNASPEAFDVVFVANATAGVKLVIDALRGREGGFWYGYHRDCHTSLVGPREVADAGHQCFSTDEAMEDWIDHHSNSPTPKLIAYPGQSNMNGRRISLDYCKRVRQSASDDTYTLFDAAGLVSTSPLDLGDLSTAPDFTVLSFYKIFGFPDLGALIVRKDCGHIFDSRQYFGGGTVEMVSALDEAWHEKKESSLHARLEDGTLPIRNIMALDCAIRAHKKLYGSMSDISNHTSFLAETLYNRLIQIKHSTGTPVCHVYKDATSSYSDSKTQGATVTFNILDSQGRWKSVHEINKIAAVRNIHIRTGTLCNPGGMAAALEINSSDLKRFFAAGFRCGNENDVRAGKPIGMARASLGAMSTLEDVDKFINFVQEFFVEQTTPVKSATSPVLNRLSIESLTVYPIKSCGGYQIPNHTTWTVRPEGLAWDREWCLVHQITKTALSQKRCPGMALLKPSLDLDTASLKIRYDGNSSTEVPSEISIPLSVDDELFLPAYPSLSCPTNVCGDKVQPRMYASDSYSTFFSVHLGIPCQLARLPASSNSSPHRVVKEHKGTQKVRNIYSPTPQYATIPGAFPTPPPSPPPRPLLLANESPILTISRSSLTQLNGCIANSEPSGSLIGPEVFRANIVLDSLSQSEIVEPYVEDTWTSMRMSRPNHQVSSAEESDQAACETQATTITDIHVLGPCRRCQMVCVNQETGERGQEPFSTLAKTRSKDGGVWFGVHCGIDVFSRESTLRVGDVVECTAGA